jgi:hydroxymethylbilane synthase
VIGTSSARRGAQILKLRPDLKIIPLRGNINTRISKLENGVVDATFLAMAGLIRSGLIDNSTMRPLPTSQMLPAVSQGAIGIEILTNNNTVRKLLGPINHQPTYICTKTERSFMRVFEGSCATPIAALAEINDNIINLQCLIAKPDGSIIHSTSCSGNIADAENIGTKAALFLKNLAGENFFV